LIKINDISYRYEEALALSDINVNIVPGESIALIGPNGSGKSTFLKILNGLIFPEKGQYLFDDKKIDEKALKDKSFSKSFHKNMGFVFQDLTSFLFCATVYEEIAYGPRQMGLSEEEVDIRVKDILKLLNIEKLSDRRPYHLSGGEMRKAALGAVLIQNPKIIVLDEPMTGLDPKTKIFLRDLLIKLNENGKTIICATHEFGYFEGLFKRGIVFSENHDILRDEDYVSIMKDKEFLEENNII
jgi:cobalt/nickel transport system ATP-binding protein